jgi:SAM-dependent methyltransferase
MDWLEILPKLVSAGFSDPRLGDVKSVRVRPVDVRGGRRYQFESRRGAQAFHENLEADAAARRFETLLKTFRQAVVKTTDADLQVVDGRLRERAAERAPAVAAHDREKTYRIPEGTPVPFLVRLGVMTPDGRVKAAKQDKFRQMNRYLEFVDDVLPALPKGKIRVVDFGCGKSYLTFALHHLLRGVRGLDADIVGLDLKKDVVDACASLARELTLERLRFEVGDIAGYEGVDRADLVVSLHACDTATDAALAKAVGWKASAILAVPCCQHEVAKGIASDAQALLLKHGILKERLASLVTDAMRAELLEAAGYAVQVVEFIDLEHTPKNLMIRALRRGKPRSRAAYRAFRAAWGAGPALERLLPE